MAKKTSKLAKDLVGPFTRIARAMSRNHKVNVIPSGFACDTDGLSTIRIPFNADDMSKVDQQVLHGMLDHEIQHVVEERQAAEAKAKGFKVLTPNDVMKRATSAAERLMVNAFEDVRIEIKASRQYIGVAENLRASNLNAVDNFKRRHGATTLEKANFWHTLASGIILTAQGFDTSWIPEGMRPYIAMCEDEIEASKTTSSVEESWDLAKRVIEKTREAAEEAKRETEKRREEKERAEREEAGAEEGAEEEEAASGGGDDEESEEDEAGAEGESEEEAEDGSEGTTGDEGGTSDEGGKEEATATGWEEASDEALEAAKRIGAGTAKDAEVSDLADYTRSDITERARRDAETHHRYIPDPEVAAQDKWLKPLGDKIAYDYSAAIVASQVHALRSKLLTILRARAEAHHVGDKERGALDTAALYSLRLGNKRVFSQRTKADVINTAVSIVLDLSGSMRGAKSEMTRQMAIALGETFSALHIPFEIIGFHNPSRGGRFTLPRSHEYSRYMPFDYYLFKGFHEGYKSTRNRLSAVSGYEQNVDGEAILTCAYRLAERPEVRKIMFVLSDGEPAGGCDAADSQQHLIDVTKRITASGIELIGIGAQTAAVERWYNKENGATNVVIENIDQLAVQVYKIMRARLLGRSAA